MTSVAPDLLLRQFFFPPVLEDAPMNTTPAKLSTARGEYVTSVAPVLPMRQFFFPLVFDVG